MNRCHHLFIYAFHINDSIWMADQKTKVHSNVTCYMWILKNVFVAVSICFLNFFLTIVINSINK